MEQNSPPSEKVGATQVAPVAFIKSSAVPRCTDAAECEAVLQVGIFFDGTNNNVDLDLSVLGHSNIARLSQAYLSAPEQGCFMIYVPGVGTPCPAIGEYKHTTFGSAFGSGGEGRILFALLRVINVIHKFAVGTSLLSADQIRVLCQAQTITRQDKKMLRDLGHPDGLLGGSAWKGLIEGFGDDLQNKLRDRQKPKILECIFDVFGFSRGATEARVFCHWLRQVMRNQQIAGIPCRFRFLGVMDTVASVGVLDGTKNSVFNETGGHGAWVRPESLRISDVVENCVHMVAMHELRKNFPLDQVANGDRLPSNCYEFAYPGSHSDVGGGYKPGELGISVGSNPEEGDSLKLSQIPLNHMFDCAVKAGVPLAKERAIGGKCKDPFAIHDALQQAFNKFLEISSTTPRRLSDWALPYLIWRWKIRHQFSRSEQVIMSVEADRKLLLAANRDFGADGDQLDFFASIAKSREYTRRARSEKNFNLGDAHFIQHSLALLDPEAAELKERTASQPPVSPEVAKFFDRFVHDSMAGFRKDLVEPTGLWRYRRVFRGSLKPMLG